ncbi:MAG: D-lactate dehydrogenase [Candidatus Anoxychlamydiales bacterium]|nr:D-lactate dehydrogenase [Candidatus Anoxychlamydiales bacterium]
MKIAIFGSQEYDIESLNEANKKYSYDLTFFKAYLNEKTASLAKDFDAVCIFVQDTANKAVIDILAKEGVKTIALRCAGFNNVDLDSAKTNNISVVNVPAYSPHAVAEHAIGLILSLNRKIHHAYLRIRDGNFSLKGFLGFDLYGKTVGVVGTGKIGQETAKILKLGFGCKVIAADPYPNKSLEKEHKIEYVDLNVLLKNSDIISLHCPLTPQTKHMINKESIAKMKKGVMLINTSRGTLINTQEVIDALKSQQIGYLGLDVYEEETSLFYQDLSSSIITDDVFARLTTFPNVLITSHQGFFTKEALTTISNTTFENIEKISKNEKCENELTKK